MPVSPSPSALMSSVSVAAVFSVGLVSAFVDPTIAALLNIFRARSSASVSSPPRPVSTLPGYVSFTGTVRRSIGVTKDDPEGVVGHPAE